MKINGMIFPTSTSNDSIFLMCWWCNCYVAMLFLWFLESAIVGCFWLFVGTVFSFSWILRLLHLLRCCVSVVGFAFRPYLRLRSCFVFICYLLYRPSAFLFASWVYSDVPLLIYIYFLPDKKRRRKGCALIHSWS